MQHLKHYRIQVTRRARSLLSVGSDKEPLHVLGNPEKKLYDDPMKISHLSLHKLVIVHINSSFVTLGRG